MPKVKKVNFALLGLGKLGSGFYKVWEQKKENIKQETGFELNLKKILVKNIHFKRPAYIDKTLLTTNIDDILDDPSIDVVIDAIGGIEPVFSILKKVIARGIHIISANRTLLASKMHTISQLVQDQNILLLPETAMGGGVPIISTLRHDLVANNVQAVIGILSGTSNYILSQMTEKKITLKAALKSTNLMQMAESLSVIDYEGTDAAQKVSILAAGAFGLKVDYLDIPASGISDISLFDIQCADEFGYEIKPLAVLKQSPDFFEIHIHPTFVPKGHPITLIKGDQNVYFVQTDLIGEYMIYGRGIGAEAASSLLLRDLVAAGSLTRAHSSRRREYRINWNHKPILPMEDIVSAYYIRFPCIDEPGVVGKITTALGDADINLASAHAEVDKKVYPDLGYVHILVDSAPEHAVIKAIRSIEQMDILKGRAKFFRILRS